MEGKDFGLDPDPVFNLLYVLGLAALAVFSILLDCVGVPILKFPLLLQLRFNDRGHTVTVSKLFFLYFLDYVFLAPCFLGFRDFYFFYVANPVDPRPVNVY